MGQQTQRCRIFISVCIKCIYTFSYAFSSHNFGKSVSGTNQLLLSSHTETSHGTFYCVCIRVLYLSSSEKNHHKKAIQTKDLLIIAQELKEK